MLQQLLDAAASTPKGKAPSPMKRKYMEAFPQTMGPPAIITPGTSGKKKKGKSERAKLVERLAYQNMKVYERLHAAGIMEKTPRTCLTSITSSNRAKGVRSDKQQTHSAR